MGQYCPYVRPDVFDAFDAFDATPGATVGAIFEAAFDALTLAV